MPEAHGSTRTGDHGRRVGCLRHGMIASRGQRLDDVEAVRGPYVDREAPTSA